MLKQVFLSPAMLVVGVLAAIAAVANLSAEMVWSSGLFNGLAGWIAEAIWFTVFLVEAMIYISGLFAAVWFLQNHLWPEKDGVKQRTANRVLILAIMVANILFVVNSQKVLVAVLGITDLEGVFAEAPTEEPAARGCAFLSEPEAVPAEQPKESLLSAPLPVDRSVTPAKKGLSILETAAASAIDDLRKRRVESLARPGQLVADVADKELAVLTVLGELPLDCSPFDPDKSKAEQVACLTVLLEKIGEDPNQFYDPAQIQDDTFGWLRSVYPAAGLDSPEAARTDLTVALKAVALHHDYSESVLTPSAKSEIKSRDWLRRALEAAYNAHVDHVSAAIAGHRVNWRKPGRGLPEKTQALLRKFIWVSENLEAAVS